MLIQTKFLKEALKRIGATRNGGKNLSVRVSKTRVGKGYDGKAIYEYGNAECHTDALTKEQEEKLKQISQYFEIYTHKECNFSIIKY